MPIFDLMVILSDAVSDITFGDDALTGSTSGIEGIGSSDAASCIGELAMTLT